MNIYDVCYPMQDNFMMFCILPTDILYFLEIGLYCCEKLVKCLFLSDTTDVFRDHDFL